MSVDKDLAYDAWRTRGPEPDDEDEARAQWEEDNGIIEILGEDAVSMLLWDAYTGEDIRFRVDRLMDKAWEKQKKDWEETW